MRFIILCVKENSGKTGSQILSLRAFLYSSVPYSGPLPSRAEPLKAVAVLIRPTGQRQKIIVPWDLLAYCV